jgi:3',5'-cyclic AMP phosphodiesterase CpdA
VRIVQVSDTHISHAGGVTTDNLEKVVDHVNRRLRPDLVVSTGDLNLLSPDSEGDRAAAHRLHGAFDAPVAVLPGNHDVGEPGDHPWAAFGVTSERVTAFRSVFGPDRWCHEVGGWAVVGLNSELCSSGLVEEAEQWAWLDQLGDDLAGRPTLLFLHKPLWSPATEPTEHALSLTEADRRRLLAALEPVDLRLVASGHLHRYSLVERDGYQVVSAPSTAFPVSAPYLGPGQEVVGLVEYRDEGGRLSVELHRVPGLVERPARQIPEFLATWEELEVGPLP